MLVYGGVCDDARARQVQVQRNPDDPSCEAARGHRAVQDQPKGTRAAVPPVAGKLAMSTWMGPGLRTRTLHTYPFPFGLSRARCVASCFAPLLVVRGPASCMMVHVHSVAARVRRHEQAVRLGYSRMLARDADSAGSLGDILASLRHRRRHTCPQRLGGGGGWPLLEQVDRRTVGRHKRRIAAPMRRAMPPSSGQTCRRTPTRSTWLTRGQRLSLARLVAR